MGMKGAFTELKKYQHSWGFVREGRRQLYIISQEGKKPNKTKEKTPVTLSEPSSLLLWNKPSC